MTVAIVGGGAMGEAILAGALARGVLARDGTTVVEQLPDRRAALAERYGVATVAEASEAARDASLVLLAIKPGEYERVAARLDDDALLVSVMAGVRMAALAEHFAHRRIVRVMPNTPAAVNEGMSVWTATAEVDAAQRETVRALLGAIGHELEVAEEAAIDMATALSGSGPAYVFLFVEALTEAGEAIGLTREQARELTLRTLAGSAAYALRSEHSPAELRERVTSPGGTTAAGLRELERGGFREMVAACVRAAHARSRELGEGAPGP